MFSKNKIAALVAEFLGTGVLAFAVLTVSRSQIGIPYFVAFAAGLAVVLLGVALQRDVHLNPALTLGLWTGRRIRTVKAVAFIAVQLLGGFAAFELYKYFSRGPVQPLSTAYDGRVLVAEALGTFVFAFIVAGVAYRRQHWLVRTVTSGGGLALGILVASVASAAFVNPAVALAANAWAWTTYVLGPVLGAIIGVNLYGLLFAPKDGKRLDAEPAAVAESSLREAEITEEEDEAIEAEIEAEEAAEEAAEERKKADEARVASKSSKKAAKRKSKK